MSIINWFNKLSSKKVYSNIVVRVSINSITDGIRLIVKIGNNIIGKSINICKSDTNNFTKFINDNREFNNFEFVIFGNIMTISSESDNGTIQDIIGVNLLEDYFGNRITRLIANNESLQLK